MKGFPRSLTCSLSMTADDVIHLASNSQSKSTACFEFISLVVLVVVNALFVAAPLSVSPAFLLQAL